jgi:hypothetical protein
VVGDHDETLQVTFKAGRYAVMGTPADGTVLGYEITGKKTMPSVISCPCCPCPTRSKLLEDASVTSDGVTTTLLTFTKLLKEEREVEILANGGDLIFWYAVGNVGQPDLQFHKKFGQIIVNLLANNA